MTKMIFAILGPTCAGKTTFLEYAKQEKGDKVHLVEVGKEMRERYPADYFQGQDAPQHTQAEAWELCIDGINKGLEDPNVQIILVDGQPRSLDQVDKMIEISKGRIPCVYFAFTADREERERRIGVRFDPNNPEHTKSIELAKARIVNDMITGYEMLVELLSRGQTVQVVKTNSSSCFGDILKKMERFYSMADKLYRAPSTEDQKRAQNEEG